MKTTTRQLDAQLKRGLAPLYAVHGPEALLALEAADKIREAAPIAKEAEEQLLFKDMQLELADRILRQVAIARRDM